MLFYCMTIFKTFFQKWGEKIKGVFSKFSPHLVSAFDASQKKSCIFSAVHQYKAATLLPPRLLPFLCSKKYLQKVALSSVMELELWMLAAKMIKYWLEKVKCWDFLLQKEWKPFCENPKLAESSRYDKRFLSETQDSITLDPFYHFVPK